MRALPLFALTVAPAFAWAEQINLGDPSGQAALTMGFSMDCHRPENEKLCLGKDVKVPPPAALEKKARRAPLGQASGTIRKRSGVPFLDDQPLPAER